MRVTKLELRNFRGINSGFELPAACIVAGPNFSGKSTIPIALRLACVGSMPPPIGKAGIWPAFAGNADEPGKMSVTATTDTGLTWSLEWEKKKESVSQRGQPPESCALPPVLCDPATFWQMTGAEQSRAVFAASGASVKRDDLIAEIQSVDGSPARVRDEVVALLVQLMEQRFNANVEASAATTLWASDCAAIAKEERGKVKRLEAKTASAFWSGPVPTDKTKALAEARAKLAEATGEETALRKAAAKHSLESQRAERARERLEELDAMLASGEDPEPARQTEEEAEQYARAEQRLAELTEASSDATDAFERLAANHALIVKGTCPCCGQSGPELGRVIAAMELELAEQERKMTALAEQITDARREMSTLSASNAAQFHKRTQWEQRHAQLELLRREQKTLADMAPQPGTAPSPENIAKATKDREQATERVVELEGAQAEFARWACVRDERDKAESDLIRSRCSVEVVAEAVKKVTAKLDAVAGAAFGETLKVANRLCGGLLASPLEFRDGVLGRKASTVDVERTGGTVRPGAWIPHTSFSGTEALIGYAGFAVAVASKPPFRLAVLDELNRLTADRKRSLVSRILLLLSEGVIDQFVGCDTEAAETFSLIDAARWEF